MHRWGNHDEYKSYALIRGGVAQRYIDLMRETHLETADQTIERLIRLVDPRLQLLTPDVSRQ